MVVHVIRSSTRSSSLVKMVLGCMVLHSCLMRESMTKKSVLQCRHCRCKTVLRLLCIFLYLLIITISDSGSLRCLVVDVMILTFKVNIPTIYLDKLVYLNGLKHGFEARKELLLCQVAGCESRTTCDKHISPFDGFHLPCVHQIIL